MVQMIEYGHAPLATGPEDGSQASEGRVDTGGSDWSTRCGFEPPAEREPLAQALLAVSIVTRIAGVPDELLDKLRSLLVRLESVDLP